MHRRSRCGRLAILPLIAATACLDSGWLTGVDIGGSGRRTPFDYGVMADANILVGDTVRVRTILFDSTRWSIVGPGEFVRAAGDTAPSLSILVRGTAPGAVIVTGTQACCGKTGAAQLWVADSTGLGIPTLPDTMTMRVGEYRSFPVWPVDAQYRWYRASLGWRSTDTTVVAFATPGSATVTARAPGTALVIASWATKRDTIRVSVTY